MKKYIWIMPTAGVVAATLIICLFQSCGIMHGSSIPAPPPTLIDLSNGLNDGRIILFSVLIVGVVIGAFIYRKISNLEARFDKYLHRE